MPKGPSERTTPRSNSVPDVRVKGRFGIVHEVEGKMGNGEEIELVPLLRFGHSFVREWAQDFLDVVHDLVAG